MTSTAPGEDRTREENRSLGHTSLSEDEKEVLTWSRERRLEEFHKINDGICSPLETPTRSNPITPESAYYDQHDSVHLVAQPCVLQVGSRL
jgi:hypothetical protein